VIECLPCKQKLQREREREREREDRKEKAKCKTHEREVRMCMRSLNRNVDHQGRKK
jgi:hypothetical protein